MLQTEFRKDRYHNYVVVCAQDGHRITYQDEMIRHNKIRGFLPVQIHSFDNKIEYYYDITGAQSIALILEKKQLSYMQIKKILYGISQAIRNSEEYLLSEEDFILSWEEIYLDLEKEEVKLCFYPGYAKEVCEQLHIVFEKMMGKVACEDKEAVLLIYSLYMKSGEKEATLESLLSIIETKNQDKSKVKASDKEETAEDMTEMGLEEEESKWNEEHRDRKGLECSVDYIEGERREQCAKAGMEQQDKSEEEEWEEAKRWKREESKKRGAIGWGDSENEKESPLIRREQIKGEMTRKKGSQWNWKRQIITETKEQRDKLTPVRMLEKPFVTERLDDEVEVSYFELKYYLMAGGIFFGAILTVLLLVKMGALDNAFGTSLDITKLLGVILIMGSGVMGSCLRIFRKENRSTKMAKRVTYVDPDIEEARIKPDAENGRDGIIPASFRKKAEEENQEVRQEIMGRKSEWEADEKTADSWNLETMKQVIRRRGEHTEEERIQEEAVSERKDFILTERPEHYEKTKLLAKEEDLAYFRLVPRERGKYEEMILKNFPYFIGKHKSFMDYNLSEDTISRFHAKIEKRNGDIVLMDLNSTNGTFRNGRQLVPEEEEILEDGDDIAFSNIHYIFTCPSEMAVI